MPGRSEGQFLIEDYRLTSLPLARMLRRIETPPGHEAAPTGLLIVGDIDYDGLPEAGPESRSDDSESLEVAMLEKSRGGSPGSWDSLPGFSGELQIVNRLFAAASGSRQSSVMLTRSSATEEAFLTAAPRCEYAHVVTHGYFADPNPVENSSVDEGTSPKPDPTNEDLTQLFSPAVLSGIVMAGANHPQVTGKEVRDGILRASEIESCSMSTTSLVVLSACETGLGASAGGEGLTGLQRAFHLAGARSVIASLWKVDDRATQELMTQFYTNLWIKKQSKIDALRNAQLFLLRNPVLPDGTRLTRGEINIARPIVPDPATTRDATDPYFWAAWTLSGDWR
jgi:CHAT domain-containing protein